MSVMYESLWVPVYQHDAPPICLSSSPDLMKPTGLYHLQKGEILCSPNQTPTTGFGGYYHDSGYAKTAQY